MAVDQNYFMRPGESTAAYNARVAAYNTSKGGSSPQGPAKSLADQLDEMQKQLQELQSRAGGQQPQVQTQPPALTPSSGNAYFPGDNALVKVIGENGYDSNTIWLADVKSKTLRPFGSVQALEAVYGMPLEQLQSHINYVGSDAFGQGGVMNGFQPLSSEYSISRDGTGRALDFSSVNLSSRYGQGVNEGGEMKSYQALDGFLSVLKNEDGKITDSQVNSVLNDPNSMAFYISALAYGGYTLSDVYSDMRRKQLGLNNVTPISATQTRRDYQSTADYKAAANNPQLRAPESITGLNSSVLNLPIFSIPDEAFKKLTPLLDPESDAFKDAMDEAASVIYDSQLQMLQANTDQDLSAAKALWERNKGSLEKKLGITLSNDALEAWKQIESFQNTSAENGIYGSGLMNETIDEYLTQQRRRSDLNRSSTMTDKETQDIEFYLKYASPDQLAALPADVKEKWGMTPSAETLEYFSMDNLKKLFPDETDEALQRVREQYIDPNGNLYSSLYSKYAQDKYNTQGNYNTWKSQKVMNTALLDEEAAYKPYTQPDSPFLRGTIDEKTIKDTTGNAGTSSNKINYSGSSLPSNLMNRNTAAATPVGAATSQPVTPTYKAPVTTQKTTVPSPKVTPPKVTPLITPTTSYGISPTSNLSGAKLTIPKSTGTSISTYKPSTSSSLLTNQGSTGLGGVLSGAKDWISSLWNKKK